MTVASTIARELLQSGFEFQLLHHRVADFSLEAARMARVPPARVAKAVLLVDGTGPVLAVIPADTLLDLEQAGLQLGRRLRLAPESEVALLFHDCALGAVPALGTAYGVETWIDERLVEAPDICFEAGDHELLVRLRVEDFLGLMRQVNFGRFTRPAIMAGLRRSRPVDSRQPAPTPVSSR